MIKLICEQCNGRLEIDERKVIQAKNYAVVLMDNIIHCPYCNTDYLSGHSLNIPQSITIQQNAGDNAVQIGAIGNNIIIKGGLHFK